jgi:hypothetical protein
LSIEISKPSIRFKLSRRCPANNVAKVESHHVIFGQALFMPRTTSLSLCIKHFFVLNCLELIQEFLFFGIHLVPATGWVNPIFGILAELEEFLVL